MNTCMFSTVFCWLAGTVWIVAHIIIFLPEEKRLTLFPMILAIAQVLTVILWFGMFIDWIIDRGQI